MRELMDETQHERKDYLDRLVVSTQWLAMKLQIPHGFRVTVGLITIVVMVVGLGLAAAHSPRGTFWTNLGFLITGASLGIGSAILIVQTLLDRNRKLVDRERQRRLLRDVGGDAIGAIQRQFGVFGNLKFQGRDLHMAWRFGIETGRLSPVGFHDEVYTNYNEAIGPTAVDHSAYEQPWMGVDEIALLMVTRALGKCYARSDLFELDELPLNDLESAAAILRKGQSDGHLTRFETMSLLSPLTYAVEKCGNLLHALKDFPIRDEPKSER